MWEITYYGSCNGGYPVKDYIDSLDAKSQAKVAWTIDLLEEFGIKLGMPYARHIEGQLWELRAHLRRNQYRIIYFLYTGRSFVLLHGFTKKTDTLPKIELEISRKRQGDYLTQRKK